MMQLRGALRRQRAQSRRSLGIDFPSEQPLRIARHRVVEAGDRRADPAAGALPRSRPDRRAPAAAAARPRLARDPDQRRAALAVGVHRRGSRSSTSCCRRRRPSASTACASCAPRPSRRSRSPSSSSAPAASRSRPNTASAACSTGSLERLRYGLWLAGQTGAPVAFSGGIGYAQEGSTAEAKVAAKIAADEFGRPIRWVESESRDTRENAALTMALLKPAGINHIVLVTHGYHMPRALRAFTRSRRPGDPGRGGADGTGQEPRDADARMAAERGRLSRHAPAAARARGHRRRRLSGGPGAMAWRGSLAIDYRLRDGRTIAHDRHDGPLRVLRALHPEGGVCHSVLVHPPGGVVGGDELAIELTLGEGAHALVTTPGATRFYRSAGATATQTLRVVAGAASRLEWLPLETIAYSGCMASNALRFELAAGAEMIGWDVTALGLPESDRPFDAGRFTQSIELPGRWLERGSIAAERRSLARFAARLGRPARPRDDVVRQRRCARPGAQRRLARRRARRRRGPPARRDDRRDLAAARRDRRSRARRRASSRRWSCCSGSGARGGRSPGASPRRRRASGPPEPHHGEAPSPARMIDAGARLWHRSCGRPHRNRPCLTRRRWT